MNARSMDIELPGGVIGTFTGLTLDYNGTLALDGELLPGVRDRLASLAGILRVVVLTADTFGTAEKSLKDLPLAVQVVQTGADKAVTVSSMGGKTVIAIGNGRNDVPMMSQAGLRIAVLGPEGASPELLGVADIVACDICDALDLLIYPLRLKATLRD